MYKPLSLEEAQKVDAFIKVISDHPKFTPITEAIMFIGGSIQRDEFDNLFFIMEAYFYDKCTITQRQTRTFYVSDITPFKRFLISGGFVGIWKQEEELKIQEIEKKKKQEERTGQQINMEADNHQNSYRQTKMIRLSIWLMIITILISILLAILTAPDHFCNFLKFFHKAH